MFTDNFRTTATNTRSARDWAVSTAHDVVRKGKRRLRLVRLLLSCETAIDEDYALSIFASLEPRHCHVCPVCGFAGKFLPFGLPPRPEAQCPYCGSLERHRLLAHMDREHAILRESKAMLHFAPEPLISDVLRRSCPYYISADISDSAADLRLNIEQLDVPDATFDTVLCSHVLEHVDDRKALSELRRVLKPEGQLVAMVPLAEGCPTTYENPEIDDPGERELHFGQKDHVRRYGADFRDRVRDAGFRVFEFTAEGADAIRFGLKLGEKVFVCQRT